MVKNKSCFSLIYEKKRQLNLTEDFNKLFIKNSVRITIMKQLRLITLASAVLLLASCSVPPALPMDNSTPMPITTATVGKSGNNPKSTENGELAIVEKMNIVFLESFPLQVA